MCIRDRYTRKTAVGYYKSKQKKTQRWYILFLVGPIIQSWNLKANCKNISRNLRAYRPNIKYEKSTVKNLSRVIGYSIATIAISHRPIGFVVFSWQYFHKQTGLIIDSVLISNQIQVVRTDAHAHNQPVSKVSDRLKFLSQLQSTISDHGLRSSSTNNYNIPRLQSRLGERAFSYAGPLACNSIPADLQNIPETSTFKKRLKTYLFNTAGAVPRGQGWPRPPVRILPPMSPQLSSW